MKKIICIGSVSKDIFFPTSDGVILKTPEDITSKQKIAFELGAKYQIEDRFEAPGGCAANVAQGLARLGIGVECYSKLGDDAVGKWVESELIKEGVGVEFLQKEKDCMSDLSAIIVDAVSGERTVFFNRDANEHLKIIPAKLVGAGFFFVSALNGYWKENLSKILKVAAQENVRVIMNPGQRNIKDDVDAVTEGVRASDIFISNKDEAIEILINSRKNFRQEKLDDEEFLLTEIAKMGPRIVAITDGERGIWAAEKEKYYFAQPLLQKAVDSTGAGDAFTSGFLAAYLLGKKMEEALAWGVSNSSNSVLYYGARKGLLNRVSIGKMAENVSVKPLN